MKNKETIILASPNIGVEVAKSMLMEKVKNTIKKEKNLKVNNVIIVDGKKYRPRTVENHVIPAITVDLFAPAEYSYSLSEITTKVTTLNKVKLSVGLVENVKQIKAKTSGLSRNVREYLIGKFNTAYVELSAIEEE